MSIDSPKIKSVGCQIDIGNSKYSSFSNLSKVSKCDLDDLDATLRSQFTDASECPSQLALALNELRGLHKQIKRHSDRLSAWDEALRQREAAVDRILNETDRRIALEVERRFKRGSEQQRAEMKLLEGQLREKTTENQRLIANFANLRDSFEKVKAERSELQDRCSKQEQKLQSLQGRVRNLKKMPSRPASSAEVKQSPDEKSKTADQSEAGASKDNASVRSLQTDFMRGPVAIALRELLSWFNYNHLGPLLAASEAPKNAEVDEALDCCLRVLPRLADLLQLHLSKLTGLQLERKLLYECLKLLHFAFMLMDWCEPTRKRKIVATLHRLGEALHRETFNDSKKPESRRMGADLRAVTSCVVLQTVTQKDLLMHTWTQLRALLAQPAARQVFSQLRGPRFVVLLLLANRDCQFTSTQLPKALELLLCLTFDPDSEGAREVALELTSPAVLALFAELLVKEDVAEAAKEKFVILFQFVLKRPVNESTAHAFRESEVLRGLQKELSLCRDSKTEKVSSYEIVLETTLALMPG